MHKGILSDKQLKLLPLIKKFSSRFGLAGGTAIALHLGHRRSVDFDLFTLGELDGHGIREIIRSDYEIQEIMFENPGELTLVVEGVKITFLKYPFRVDFSNRFEDIIDLPDVPTLAAMKAFAMGRRAKWKDYVDLFFVFKQHSFSKVVGKAQEIFGGEFNEKLFREQLSFFDDIDYSEDIEYMRGFEVNNETVKSELAGISLQR